MFIKAAIFDLDGTLLNTIETIKYYGNNALKKQGFLEIGTERYKQIVGNGAENLVRRMLGDQNCHDEEVFRNVYTDYTEAYDSNVTYLTEPYDGIMDTLKNLKENGFKLAVLSNKPHVATVLVIEKLFGKGFFDVCRGATDNCPKKPDPTAVFEILGQLKVKKSECAYFGDTGVDMKTGKAAGLYTVGVSWGFRLREELEENRADRIIDSPSEILNILK